LTASTDGSDGTVVFCEASAAAMRETLGYTGRLDPGEAGPQAELIRRFRHSRAP
jgi:hypothetical protein